MVLRQKLSDILFAVEIDKDDNAEKDHCEDIIRTADQCHDA